MIRCTFLVAAANRALFTDERASMPRPGEQVSYEGHEYEVVTASEQMSADPDDVSAGPDAEMCALVRVVPIEAGSSRS